jgi:hypothetical protein
MFDTRPVTVYKELRIQCDGCRHRLSLGGVDELDLLEKARAAGWVQDGRRDMCRGCRRKASERAWDELWARRSRRRAVHRS